MATEMDILSSAAGGMNIDRRMLDLAARNVAAAQASSPDHPYARLVADAAAAPSADGDEAMSSGVDEIPGFDDDGAAAAVSGGVHTEPGTGDALTEMIAVLDAQRAYEQNASVFDIGKRLAERTLDIGRG